MESLTDKKRYWEAKFVFLGIYFAGLQLADGLVSWLVISKGGGFEGNSLLASIAGEWWFGLVKFLFVGLVVWGVYKRIGGSEAKFKMASVAFLVLVGFYTFVVAWNLFLLRMVF